jgi:hypothetical protein
VRVTPEKLIDLAREEAEQRGQSEDVVSGYLIGSLASGDPIIADTADIDLVLIHKYEPQRRREFIPLSENIHLDISHHPIELYSSPPELRVHPWLGPSMCEPIFLYDPDHFFERAQAGVRGQFYQLDYIHQRAAAFLSRARMCKSNLHSDRAWIRNYADCLLEASNALATLGGFPVAGRRFTLLLKSRLIELDFEDQFNEIQGLLGADLLNQDSISHWIPAWEAAFNEVAYLDPGLNLARKNYFLQGFLNLIESENSEANLWNLLTTWNLAIDSLERSGEYPQHTSFWEEVLTQLKLTSQFRDLREMELEQYLDRIEELIENWS